MDHCVSSFVFRAPYIIEVIPTIKTGQDIQAGSDGISCLGTLFTNSYNYNLSAHCSALRKQHRQTNQEQSRNRL